MIVVVILVDLLTLEVGEDVEDFAVEDLAHASIPDSITCAPKNYKTLLIQPFVKPAHLNINAD